MLKEVGKDAYEMALPYNLMIHDVFHVSILRSYLKVPAQKIPLEDIELVNDCHLK